MDYFSVIILVIVAFVFISDRNIKSIEKIKQEKTDVNVEQEINDINEQLEIIERDVKNINIYNLKNIIGKTNNQYILIHNPDIKLNKEQINIIVANYINLDKAPCGFNLLYTYQDKKFSLKKLYLDIVNYLNIFNKKEISSYGIIICKKDDLLLNENEFKDKINSFTPNEITDIEYGKQDINILKIKNIYLEKISNANIEIILKIILLIISGSIITTNLIYAIFNINSDINNLIISLVIYYCYSYIIRYIYKPLGRKRLIVTYIFPIYFIAYIVIVIYTWISNVIKNVHAS